MQDIQSSVIPLPPIEYIARILSSLTHFLLILLPILTQRLMRVHLIAKGADIRLEFYQLAFRYENVDRVDVIAFGCKVLPVSRLYK